MYPLSSLTGAQLEQLPLGRKTKRARRRNFNWEAKDGYGRQECPRQKFREGTRRQLDTHNEFCLFLVGPSILENIN
jgi:hypothetical protein